MTSLRPVLGALALDAVLVTVFTALGRASHGENPIVGLWTTAWPFLAGLAVAWIVTLAWRAPHRPVRTGIPVWIITVAAGMLLRALSGQGTALPFIIVATLMVALFLVGWRIIAVVVVRARARRKDAGAPTTGTGSAA